MKVPEAMTLLIHALWWQVQPSEKVYSCKYSGNCFIQAKLWNTNGKHGGPCNKRFNQNERPAEQNIAVTNTIQYWYMLIKCNESWAQSKCFPFCIGISKLGPSIQWWEITAWQRGEARSSSWRTLPSGVCLITLFTLVTSQKALHPNLLHYQPLEQESQGQAEKRSCSMEVHVLLKAAKR